MRIKGIVLFGIVAVMLTIASTWHAPSLTSSANVNAATPIQMSIVINGLAQGENATLVIGPEAPDLNETNALFEYPVNGTGVSIKEDISPVLDDGHYLLLLDAPSHYFRDPKGYFFSIRDSVVAANPPGEIFTFNLEPQLPYPVLEAIVALGTVMSPISVLPPPASATSATYDQPPSLQNLLMAIVIALIVIALAAITIWWSWASVKHKV